MRIKELTDGHMEVIRYLASAGLNVVFIDNELFTVHTFLPSDNNIPKTAIVGINITKIAAAHVQGAAITVQQQTSLLSQIEMESAQRREYSPHFQWIMY